MQSNDDDETNLSVFSACEFRENFGVFISLMRSHELRDHNVST